MCVAQLIDFFYKPIPGTAAHRKILSKECAAGDTTVACKHPN
jgi:hypothetical protein